MGKMTGNEFLVKALQEEGVEKIFGYPGACVIDIFDEIYKQDQVELILPRHEQGLIHAADGYARATGKVGVCLATSGDLGHLKHDLILAASTRRVCAIGVFAGQWLPKSSR